ncbi:MAG: response regulator [Deltaproteobacteria bacterium]|nr:response regulator [Deltaproteobacteria bacterium]
MNDFGTASFPNTPPHFSILLVDDNRDFVEFLCYLLSHRGFEVQCAYSGAECLDMVRRQEFDLVILDVMMPKMDGLTVCRELKKIAPTLPVFLLTAKDDLATRTAALELGASEYLNKPVNIEDFITRVRTQCHISQWDKSVATTLGAKA